MSAGVSFDVLLAYLDEEAGKWEKWFAENHAAFDVKVDVANVGDARGMLHHIFAVEKLYVRRLRQEPPITPNDVPREPETELFAVGKQARLDLRAIASEKGDSGLDESFTFKTSTYGDITASYRKCLTQVIVHSIRHWAQLATTLRQSGFKQPWGHDFLLSTAMK